MSPSDDLTGVVSQNTPEDTDLLGWKIAKYLFTVWIGWTAGMFFGAGLYASSSPVIQEVLTRPVGVGPIDIPIRYFGLVAFMMAMTLTLYFVHQDYGV